MNNIGDVLYLDDHRCHGSDQAPSDREAAEDPIRSLGEGEWKTV